MKKISYEEIFELYINQNLSQVEVAKKIGCSRSKISSTIKKYNIKKDQAQINALKKETSIRKYGVEFPTQSSEIQSKIKETNLKRYGVDRPTKSKAVQEKVRKTVLDRYGTNSPAENSKIKSKMRKTNLKKYGVENPFSSKEVQAKIKKTNLERYGVENPSSLECVKAKKEKVFLKKYGTKSPFESKDIQKKIELANIDRYGHSNPMKNKSVSNKMVMTKHEHGVTSIYFGKTVPTWAKEYEVPEMALYRVIDTFSSENEFLDFISSYESGSSDIENFIKKALNISFWNKKIHEELKYRPDFKLSEKSALNADGLYWHSELVQEDKYYHFNMRKEYEALGLRIFQFRADEILNPFKMKIIKSMINNHLNKVSLRIGARKTALKIISNSNAKEFLNQNHIKGHKDAKHFGLIYKDEIISLMSYKVISGVLKIERFCSKVDTQVMGAFSKLLKRIKLEADFDKIHYWVDLRYGTGSFLLKQGFELKRDVLGWEWTDRNFTYNRLKCRANMYGEKLSEKEHAKRLGWSKVYDAGQRLYAKEA